MKMPTTDLWKSEKEMQRYDSLVYTEQDARMRHSIEEKQKQQQTNVREEEGGKK